MAAQQGHSSILGLIHWSVQYLGCNVRARVDKARRFFNCGGMQKLTNKTSGKLALRWGLFAAILLYLTYQLSKIGWAEIWAALPTSPVFYLLSIGFVLAPVMAERLSFQTIIGHKMPVREAGGGKAMWLSKLFLRKHVLNRAVMNYAGDAFFIQRLSQMPGPKVNGENAQLGLRGAAIIMKDMGLVRMFVANFWIMLLAAVIAFGDFSVLQKIAAVSPAAVVAVSALCLLVCVGGIVLFRKLTRLPLDVAGKVALIYLIRSVVVAAILIAQWSFALPGNTLADWVVFLIVFSVAKKSPVGGDLVFASVVVTLPGLAGDSAAVAAMLVALAAVAQALYFIGFLITSETGSKQSDAA